MAKQTWRRVAEPSEDMVHFSGPFILGNVTLCGMTDWLKSPDGDGEPTTEPVNCQGCLGIIEFVRERPMPPELR